MSICQACQHKEKRPAPHARRTKECFDILIAALRNVAERYGYALAVHGSLEYDIDLVAVPWREHACSQASVAEAIRNAAEVIIGIARIRAVDQDRLPAKKPNGRLAWSFYLVPEGLDGPYIDLSVMPPREG